MSSTPAPDVQTKSKSERYILNAMSHLWPKEGIVELRILGSGRGVISGYYDNPKAFARDAALWSGKAAGVYWTINPCNPALLARANNRLKEYVRTGELTSDADIIRRRFLPVDIDPTRRAGVSATHEEHLEALALQGRIADSDFIAALRFSQPIEMDSGNGAYLLYPIDVPNDDANTATIRGCLEALAARFNCAVAKVDTSTHNASRILRVPGTLNCKGDHTPERPHRRAILTIVPGVEL